MPEADRKHPRHLNIQMDGYELAARVRDQYPDIQILMASGYNENPDYQNPDVSASSSQPLLHKPYRGRDLLIKVRELLP